jgi:hypothetical protein
MVSSISVTYRPSNGIYFESADIGNCFLWREISQVHKTQNGIYQRNGCLISLLTDFGRINPCYPDTHGAQNDTILYTGGGRRGDQRLDARNQAVLDAVVSRISVPLFNKLARGKWEYLGLWTVEAGEYISDENQDRMVWKFTLKVDRGEGAMEVLR